MSGRAIFALLCLAALGLTLATPIPALTDYPNHLARMALLAAERAGDPSPYYVASWGFYPNLAMDLIVPPLGRFMSIETAARLFLLLAQVLLISGALALEYAVKRRLQLSGFVALLALNAFPFARGFVNFEFGLGVALWGVAGWIALREKSVVARVALHCVCVVALYLCHLFAFAAYGFTLGVYELWRGWRARAPGRLAGELALLAAPVAAGAALLGRGGASGAAQQFDWAWAAKPLWPAVALNGGDLLLSTLSLGGLILMVSRLRRVGALRLESAGGFLAVGFAALYVVTPEKMQGAMYGSYMDVRVLAAAALILPAFIAVDWPDARVRRALLGAMAGLVAANLLHTAWVWTSYRADYAAVIASFSKLERGKKVLVASAVEENPFRDQDIAPLYHAPALAAPYAKALVSTLMADPGKQPLAARPPFARLNPQNAPLLGLDDLVGATRGAALEQEAFRSWPLDYDYVYLIAAPAPNPLPDLLEPLASERRFALYRIRKPAG